jgi:hypothetical protein
MLDSRQRLRLWFWITHAFPLMQLHGEEGISSVYHPECALDGLCTMRSHGVFMYTGQLSHHRLRDRPTHRSKFAVLKGLYSERRSIQYLFFRCSCSFLSIYS